MIVKHPLRFTLPALFLSLFLIPACNLEQNIDVDLPSYESELTVECYLEPGRPFRLLLSESLGYFESAQTNPIIDNASVTITHAGGTVNLINGFVVDPEFDKFYNFYSSDLVPATVGAEYTLNITDDRGRSITGTTTMLPTVDIDSLVPQFNTSDTLALVLTYFAEPEGDNWYRRQLHFGETVRTAVVDQDFVTDDNLETEDNNFVFGSGFEFGVGDTVFSTLYNIEEPYYDFLVSAFDAISSNGNPFASPSSIKSNVDGGLGIFTCLSYDRDTIIIPE